MEAEDAGPLRVALYTRVSTDEQAKSGCSIPDQERALIAHAELRDWRVVEVIKDDGYSGASDDRPCLRRVMELAQAREIDTAVAVKRDRFFRNHFLRLWWDRDLKDLGVRLVALNDTGNRFADGLQEGYAEWEHEQIAERTGNGKRAKARQGKVVGGHPVPYGYQYLRDGYGKPTAYAVDEPAMRVVRRIFGDLAQGNSLCGLEDKLDAERVSTPGTARGWNRQTLRSIIRNDIYKPHTVEELREAGVTETVLLALDKETLYGIYSFAGIPVPIPNAGVPREVVEAARLKIHDNRSPSRSDNRFWGLSGGVLRCADCGRAMQTVTIPQKNRTYHYYRCQSATNGRTDPCTMSKYINAEAIEADVWEVVRRVMDDKEYLLRKVRERFAEKRRDLSGPGMDSGALARQLEENETKWVKYQWAFEAEALSLADLKARRAELEVKRERLKDDLERARNRKAELEKLAKTERSVSERIQEGYGDLDETSPQQHREIYQDLSVHVEVGADKRPLIWGVFPMQYPKGFFRLAGDTGYVIVSGTETSR